jgi:acyl dehydratase
MTPPQTVTTTMADLPSLIGTTLGPTEWFDMTQEHVNAFADLTGDHNYIHVDVEGAKSSPFGGTIAHGFLSLAMMAPIGQRLQVSDAATAVNYGLDKVRFPAPLPVGRRWRGRGEIVSVEEVKGGVQVKMNNTIEVEGADRPTVAAECLVRFYA